jgi:D-3-phosphoglycerate dehydrogenase / 2-oxoglutarate reductase
MYVKLLQTEKKMKRIKVLVTDPLSKEGVEILKKAGFDVDESGKLSPEELSKIIGEYDALIVRSGTKVTKEVIEKSKNLKVIGRAGVGLDNVDIEAATPAGIIVMNAPEGNTISAAEHTVAMMMSLSRNIPVASQSMKDGKWEKKKFMGTELYNKTLGVVGLGRIGMRVASVGRCMGMKVIGFDPYVDQEEARDAGIHLLNLTGLLKKADFITFHIPLSAETHHMIGDAEFEIMKDEVRLLNCARGGIIDEKALYKYIKKGKVKGAALDVFEEEPPHGNPLLECDEIIATPHLGASTKEAQVNVAQQIARQVVSAIKKQTVKNAVNLPSADESHTKQVRGYLSLGEKIGRIIRQLAKSETKKIDIYYNGEIASYDLSMLRANILVGFFKSSGEKVNLVNVPLMLKESGIKLEEKRTEEAGEFSNLITVEVKGREKTSVAGTLIRKGEERIVKINDFDVEAVPKGYLLVCDNADKPGIMGHIGEILGKRNINIASMTLGRRKKGGSAITVLNLDQSIDKEILNEIKKFPAIQSVRLVKI